MKDRPARRHPHSTCPERWPPRIVRRAPVERPEAVTGIAWQVFLLLERPSQVVVPSVLLVSEVLRRPLESAQYLCVVYSDRLAANSIVASVGSKGDSYDNALAESFNGLYKWELIYRRRPWAGLEDVKFATLEYVDWFNNRRLHGQIAPGRGYTTPAAFEEEYHRNIALTEGVGTQTDESL